MEAAEPPHVHAFARVVAERLGCSTIVDVGCGSPHQLAALQSQFELVGVGSDSRIVRGRATCPHADWITVDLNDPRPLPLNDERLRQSVLVCVNTLEWLHDPLSLLRNIRRCLDVAPLCIVSTPDRELVQFPRRTASAAPRGNAAVWTLGEFEALLRSLELDVHFVGWTAASEERLEKTLTLAVLGGQLGRGFSAMEAPSSFRVAAVIPAYNEADVIVPCVQRLLEQHMEVYVVDNWSTDGTYELVRAIEHAGLLGVERFPPDGPAVHWNLGDLLNRIEAVGSSLGADWLVYHDADEVRLGPWEEHSQRDALYRADAAGFNAVNHTAINFKPVDDLFRPGAEFWKHFRYWEWGASPLRVPHIKAWKVTGHRVGLAESGGHSVDFPDRRIFPYNFLLKHYRIRSQAHGERKVLRDRLPRLNPEERARGWNMHYEALAQHPSFIARPEELHLFDEELFSRVYLVERLSGVAIDR